MLKNILLFALVCTLSWLSGQNVETIDNSVTTQHQDLSINGRKLISEDTALLPKGTSGIATVKVCINNEGNVTYTEVMKVGTTITERNVFVEIMKKIKTLTFDKNAAKTEECGLLLIEK